VTFDSEAIKKLLDGRAPNQQKSLLSKLTFVLSKADLVAPAPWILYKDQNQVVIDASETTVAQNNDWLAKLIADVIGVVVRIGSALWDWITQQFT
jgi:hypothetical protein